jgi:hypothetical protein
MLRRDVPKALLASAAGAAVVAQQAQAQSCTPPCYPATATETAAQVTPSNLTYPPGDLRRYGAVGDGVADDTAAVSKLLKVAVSSGFGLLPPGIYRVSSTLTTHLTQESETAPNTVLKGITLSAYGATIDFNPSGNQTGYALDFYSFHTSAEFYQPQLTIAGLNIKCSPAASGGIRINDISNARLTDVYVQNATAGAGITLRNTATWCENTRLVGCGAVNCLNGVTFERINENAPKPSSSSFARTYVNHFFGAGITNYWFVINGNTSVYDSQFDHISGNFGSIAYFLVSGDMTGSIITGIHTEVNATKAGQGAIRIANYPNTVDVRRRPVLLHLSPYAVFNGSGTIPVWTDGNGAAISGPEPVQQQVLSTDLILDRPAPNVIPGRVAFGNTTSTTASVGTRGALPAQVAGYLVINIGGTNYKIPYYGA